MVIKNWSGIYCTSLNSQYFEKYWTERNTKWSYRESQQGNQEKSRFNLSIHGHHQYHENTWRARTGGVSQRWAHAKCRSPPGTVLDTVWGLGVKGDLRLWYCTKGEVGLSPLLRSSQLGGTEHQWSPASKASLLSKQELPHSASGFPPHLFHWDSLGLGPSASLQMILKYLFWEKIFPAMF